MIDLNNTNFDNLGLADAFKLLTEADNLETITVNPGESAQQARERFASYRAALGRHIFALQQGPEAPDAFNANAQALIRNGHEERLKTNAARIEELKSKLQ